MVRCVVVRCVVVGCVVVGCVSWYMLLLLVMSILLLLVMQIPTLRTSLPPNFNQFDSRLINMWEEEE